MSVEPSYTAAETLSADSTEGKMVLKYFQVNCCLQSFCQCAVGLSKPSLLISLGFFTCSLKFAIGMFLTRSQYHFHSSCWGKKGMQQPCSGGGPCYVNYPSVLLYEACWCLKGLWDIALDSGLLFTAYISCCARRFSGCLNAECMWS